MEVSNKFRRKRINKLGVRNNMIHYLELKEKSREFQIPISTIERDYAQNWILKHLSEIDMVLKGGTGIKKVFIDDYRFSDDLDFTLMSNISRENLSKQINASVKFAKRESGINFSEDDSVLIENTNGFEGNIYFTILNRSRARLRIKIDITGYGRELILLPISERKIKHLYSDNFNSRIKVYELEEIFAEKIRTLFDRTRPRDLYDVWRLKEHINLDICRKIIKEKFEFKNVEIDFYSLNNRKKDFEVSWDNSLKHQITELPVFNIVFTDIFKFLNGFL